MTEAFNGSTGQRSGQPPVTGRDSGAQTSQSPATPQTGAGAAPPPASSGPDFSNFDWDSNLDKIPWDKADIKRIERIPGVSKMQQTFQKKLRESEDRAQSELAAMAAQLQQYQQIVAGQFPDAAPQLQTIQQQAEHARDRARLDNYERQRALSQLSADYDVPVSLFEDNPPRDPTEAFLRVADYHRNARKEAESTLSQQMADLKRQLDAINNARTDPAANADVGVAVPGGNSYQTEWERLTKEGRHREANALYAQAEEKGLNIDVSRMKPPGWF